MNGSHRYVKASQRPVIEYPGPSRPNGARNQLMIPFSPSIVRQVYALTR